MRFFKSLLVGLIFIGLMSLFWFGLNQDPKKIPSALINKNIPKFIVNDLLNEQNSYSEAIFNDKISLINIWASWCVSCYQDRSER